MKDTVRIYDRMDEDIPYGDDIYIVDTHEGYVVYKNIYNVTFSEKFSKKEDACRYYEKEVAKRKKCTM